MTDKMLKAVVQSETQEPKTDKDVSAIFERANTLSMGGQYKEAANFLSNELVRNPNDVVLWDRWEEAVDDLLAVGNFLTASHCVESVLKRTEDHTPAHLSACGMRQTVYDRMTVS